MPRGKRRNKTGSAGASRYDASQSAWEDAYGAFAELRRQLADSKEARAKRRELLAELAGCKDAQRAWLILEDYLDRLSLSPNDFAGGEWWPRLVKAEGERRIQELALLFLQRGRRLPSELQERLDPTRLARLSLEEEEREYAKALEAWLAGGSQERPETRAPRLRVQAAARPAPGAEGLWRLEARFALFRRRSGFEERSPIDLIEVVRRPGAERDLFGRREWKFLKWFAARYEGRLDAEANSIALEGLELAEWLTQWGEPPFIEWADRPDHVLFFGGSAELTRELREEKGEAHVVHRLRLSAGEEIELDQVRFFAGKPVFVQAGPAFYLLRRPPEEELLGKLARRPAIPARRLSQRLLAGLYRAEKSSRERWKKLCEVHTARPRFVFELADAAVRLRLRAVSDRDQSLWEWTGGEWRLLPDSDREPNRKPQIMGEDPRLDEAIDWLHSLDWFSPEPGLWLADATEQFLAELGAAWRRRPRSAEYFANRAFRRCFAAPLRPRLILQAREGSGIDWFSVSAEWECEGWTLTRTDLERLAAATERFVRLPNAGWVELDLGALREAHELAADLGLERLPAGEEAISPEQLEALEKEKLRFLAGARRLAKVRERLRRFRGLSQHEPPAALRAELRPYQREGFNFLCRLSELGLGGILADDMGLGKTVQALAWLAWLKEREGETRPSLVVCPASVLHNWRREAERFTPSLKVLLLESGPARHGLRKKIPQHDLVVTNYALLRRDLEALKKLHFRAVILDEAQFIKNPDAQASRSVKELQADNRLALTGTPLENRLLDLWSIVDFVQPGYLGTELQFLRKYEPSGPDAEWARRVARRRLSAKMRPLMLRRLKGQVAQDLPERIEQRRDCAMQPPQRRLYLAELRRSRERVLHALKTDGLAKSRMHVLAALTRLRQICCHPALVGSSAPSGKTEALFEILEPLLAEGQKVLVFSQFVRMLTILEEECRRRGYPTRLLTGETRDRHQLVQEFQGDAQPGVFLLSLRAAGTGLNLTTASYVILYDPWWNPAVEAQAIDRTHRIGQTRTVNAYRLITPGTVEEKIWALQQRKAQAIADVLGEQGFTKTLTRAELEYLFAEE